MELGSVGMGKKILDLEGGGFLLRWKGSECSDLGALAACIGADMGVKGYTDPSEGLTEVPDVARVEIFRHCLHGFIKTKLSSQTSFCSLLQADSTYGTSTFGTMNR